MTQLELIDVSRYQGDIDFAKVKKAGVSGVILRCGVTYQTDGSMGEDTNFARNYLGFTQAGLPVGAYYYSGAATLQQAEAEAAFVLKLLAGKKLGLPVYYDIEDSKRQSGLSKKDLTAIAQRFCTVLEQNGWFVGVYANTSWFLTKLDHQQLSHKYTIWLADYRKNPDTTLQRDIWQYTGSGSVAGIKGLVDRSLCYRDFPAVIAGAGLNGFGKNKFAVGDKVLYQATGTVKQVDASREAPYLVGSRWMQENELTKES